VIAGTTVFVLVGVGVGVAVGCVELCNTDFVAAGFCVGAETAGVRGFDVDGIAGGVVVLETTDALGSAALAGRGAIVGCTIGATAVGIPAMGGVLWGAAVTEP
jgi:hypothetical protein